MKSVDAVNGLPHTIDCTNIYEDVLDLYREGSIVGEYPITVTYVGEKGVDEGGVQRDMFSSFWEKAYSLLFEGATTLIPMVHPQIDLSVYSILGRILSHGYLATGILPDRVALPTLIQSLLGPGVTISQDILMEAFIDYISVTERSTLKTALNGGYDFAFPSPVLNVVMNILSRFGCRQIPKPSNLVTLIEQVVRYEFCIKPAAAIALLHSGIPLNHATFWATKTASDIQSLHHRLTATPSKVISKLDLSEASNPSEERVCGYLMTMIGNMQPLELRLFLRFITGASVCIAPKIEITFNSLSGLARRPIAHTCDFNLELSTAYTNYDDFYGDLKSILTSTGEEFSWRMDAL